MEKNFSVIGMSESIKEKGILFTKSKINTSVCFRI